LMLLFPVWLRAFGHGLVRRYSKVNSSTWTIRVLTIRGELKGISRPQELNSCHIRLIAQIWPGVTSASVDRWKGNYLITIVRPERILERDHWKFTGVDQEELLNVFKSWAN
jgi:hypothetical protein